jgi:serine/threonine-protein kinase
MNEEKDKNKTENEIDPEILAFKEEFKKKPSEIKTSGKAKSDRSGNIFMKYLPFLYVLIGFFFGIFILVMLFDNYIVPKMVHERPIIEVPDLLGMNEQDAESKLVEIGLNYEISGEQFSNEMPPGTVLRQLPNSGTEVKKGRPVYLTLSKGKETVRVPSFVGFDIRKAKLEIMKLGLKLGEIKYENSEEYPKDTIIAQTIQPGSKIEYGKRLGLTISKGSEQTIEMPLLIGQRLEDIITLLENYELRLGNVKYENSETFQQNVIIDQYPKEYEQVQLGTYINITVSQ